ncbi:MAG: hypothetical protein K6L73_04470 [Cellvibrionaceae bacterium]
MGKRSQQGMGLFEVVIVTTMLAVIILIGMGYYLKSLENGRKASITMLAKNFSEAVNVVHGKWEAKGLNKHKETSKNRKLAVDLGHGVVYVNEFGWPANTRTRSDSGSRNQTPEECAQVFLALFVNSYELTVENRQGARGKRGNGDYHVSLPQASICRYEMTDDLESAHYFDYFVKSGEVVLELTP